MTKLCTFLIGLCLLAPFVAHGGELELYFYRAPQPLDWSTPGNLVRSTVHNQRFKINGRTYPHSISHVNVRLQCANEKSVYRGMSSRKSNFSYVWDFTIKGVSLDTLLINVPGRFYTEDEILFWLPVLKQKGYVRGLKLLLNEDQCARAQRYLRLYEELQLDKVYGGLRSTPHFGQGAGCAAFGVSFLQILNFFPESLERHWQRTLAVPWELLSSKTRSARIGFIGYLRGKDRPWASPREKQIQLKFWDPELMYNWVGDIAQNKKEPSPYMWVEKDPLTPYQRVVWDVRTYPTSHDYFFAYRRGTLDSTVYYHRRNTSRLLTDEELLDQSHSTCRMFRACP